ncbi:MAG: peptidoglycan DD-metalloendopeptidase family protein [Clostridium sp.]|jgi:septal ring factor EnvC (AmiA/AmiB activator)|nr:peptidoglycan DD-metalloendopeptidase family protein [Clostridium sp.]
MERKKHKRKKNHVILVTSDAADANIRQFRVRPWLLRLAIFLLCVLVGGVAGYLYYGNKLWQIVNRRQETITRLEGEKAALETALEDQRKTHEAEVATLTDKINVLSETVKEKTQTENELSARLEKQSLPTEFPLTGSATMEEVREGDPICIFTAAQGTTVVATASGTVTAVNDDAEYGHNVWVDHGNGYVTIYRNGGEASVKAGDSVVQGTTLFLHGEENTKLGYQMMKDGAYIDPTDMLAISG